MRPLRCIATIAVAAACALAASGGVAEAKPKAPAPAPAAAHAASPTGSASSSAGGNTADPGNHKAASTSAPTNAREVVQRESKIEFDERAVQGQTAAGAIYLFQRGEAEFHSMIRTPESFRERTVQTIFPERAKP